MFSASPTRTNYAWSMSTLPPIEARAITRRESHHHLRIRKKEYTKGQNTSRFQPPFATAGVRCLLSVLPPAAVPLSSNDLASLFDALRCIQPFAASIPESLHNASTHLQGSLLIVADLDPATTKLAIGFTGPFLSAFGFLFILRIVMSWYPKLPVGRFPYVLAYAPTEPFLKIMRKVIPPLGGVDVTPVVWFGLVSFLNEILVGPQGLLVLLSQQI